MLSDALAKPKRFRFCGGLCFRGRHLFLLLGLLLLPALFFLNPPPGCCLDGGDAVLRIHEFRVDAVPTRTSKKRPDTRIA